MSEEKLSSYVTSWGVHNVRLKEYWRWSDGGGETKRASNPQRLKYHLYKSCEQHESLIIISRDLVGEGYMFQDMGVRGLGYKERLVAQAHFRRI